MTPGAPDPVTQVQFEHEVATLAEDILDPERTHAVVCVTSPSWTNEPFVDPNALAAALGHVARVYVMPTGRPSWDLTARLPPRLDVYGGATRVWWPDLAADGDPFRHPLFFAQSTTDSAKVIDEIVQRFGGEGLLELAPSAPGVEVGAVVTSVRPLEIELQLVSGEPAYALREDLPLHGLAPGRILEVGQGVRVQVLEDVSGRRVRVTLNPLAPDPWVRFAELHPPGTVVEGTVVELLGFGAMVLVFPGVKGLLHKSKITRDWVDDPADFLQIGDAAPVRVLSIDTEAHRVELTLLGVKEEDVVPPASLLPGGPPWTEPPETAPVVEEEPPAPAPSSADADGSMDVAEAPAEAEEKRLEELIDEGTAVDQRVGELFASTERRLQELRAEADQIRRVLADDLVQARRRILQFAEDETAGITGSTEQALAEARSSLEELRGRLAAAEDDRRLALAALAEERSQGERTRALAERRKNELRRERGVADELRRELDQLDPTARFVSAVQAAWERDNRGEDRERYPWRAPSLGVHFLESVDTVEGITRQKVVDVCSHVISGRAKTMPGLELHALRTSESGNAPQRDRADGAKAYRCNLQTNSPAARRLHYWELPGGGIELARVVYHDDFSIS